MVIKPLSFKTEFTYWSVKKRWLQMQWLFITRNNLLLLLQWRQLTKPKVSCLVFFFSVIPKANSVFTFELEGFVFTIHGNHFRYRSSERSARRFKPKPTVDLWHRLELCKFGARLVYIPWIHGGQIQSLVIQSCKISHFSLVSNGLLVNNIWNAWDKQG